MRKKIPLIGGIINLIESLKGDIGIIENTDVATHSISAGSYVIWHNELYKASSAIAVDDALSSSNLTAVSGGAANELNNNFIETEYTVASSVSVASHATMYMNIGTVDGYHPISVYAKFSVGSGNILPLNPYFETSENRWACRMYNISSSAQNSGTGKVGIVWMKD